MDVFDFHTWSQRKLTLHGTAVEIECACQDLLPQIDHLVQPFRESSFPEGFVPLRGCIEPYDLNDVLKHLPAKAVAQPLEGQTFDVYRDGDRYFLMDESIGLTMVDLFRRCWHSWVTSEALAGNPVRLADTAVFWPLAQLMVTQGVQMIPAVAVARDGLGILLVGDLPLEPELSSLLEQGYRIISQRWVGLREEEGRIAMLHLPGHVLQRSSPRSPLQSSGLSGGTSRFGDEQWMDLHASHPQSMQNHGFCDVVLVCEPGRRDQLRIKPVGWAGAMNVLRRAWPIVDLPIGRRGGKLVAKMASRLRVAELQLSRDPNELVKALDLLHHWPAEGGSTASDPTALAAMWAGAPLPPSLPKAKSA